MLDKIKEILAPYEPVEFKDEKGKLIGYSVFKKVRDADKKRIFDVGGDLVVSNVPDAVECYGDLSKLKNTKVSSNIELNFKEGEEEWPEEDTTQKETPKKPRSGDEE